MADLQSTCNVVVTSSKGIWKLFIYPEEFGQLWQMDTVNLISVKYINSHIAETYTLNVVCPTSPFWDYNRAAGGHRLCHSLIQWMFSNIDLGLITPRLIEA